MKRFRISSSNRITFEEKEEESLQDRWPGEENDERYEGKQPAGDLQVQGWTSFAMNSALCEIDQDRQTYIYKGLFNGISLLLMDLLSSTFFRL